MYGAHSTVLFIGGAGISNWTGLLLASHPCQSLVGCEDRLP